MNSNKAFVLKTNTIMEHIFSLIKNGTLLLNSPLPSINQIAKEFNIANETAVKAYKKLKEKGIIYSVKGKGFYVSTTDLSVKHNIFVLFDTFSAYKETLYNGMLCKFGKRATLDMYFHHYNYHSFETLINECNGKYTEYILLPYSNRNVIPIIKELPQDKLYILDCRIKGFPWKGIYQDFENDAYDCLLSMPCNYYKYKKYFFIYRNEFTNVMKEIYFGFSRFCKEKNINFEINDGTKIPEVEQGDAYLVIDDEHLVELVLKAEARNFKLGKDIGIISYNETSLKKIAAGGISVISTDFAKMGEGIADMIINDKKETLRNPCLFIDRGSF